MIDFLLGRGVDWGLVEQSLLLEAADRPCPYLSGRARSPRA